MSNQPKIPTGGIVSADITVPKTEELRDFYKEVMGWTVEEMPMEDENGKYADYIMKNKEGGWVGGVCHARGMNTDLPPQWIVYINVEDVATSVEKCKQHGGKVLKEMKGEDGTYYYALLQDPAGGVIAVTKV